MNTQPTTHDEDQELKTIWEILKRNVYHQPNNTPKTETNFLPIIHKRYKNQNGAHSHTRIMVPIQEQSQIYSRTLT